MEEEQREEERRRRRDKCNQTRNDNSVLVTPVHRIMEKTLPTSLDPWILWEDPPGAASFLGLSLGEEEEEDKLSYINNLQNHIKI